MVTTWILFALTFLLGFFIGQASKMSKEDLIKDLERDLDKLKHIGAAKATLQTPKPFINRSGVGAVMRPTQQDIYLKENPEIKEETEEMSKVFNDLGVKDGSSDN